MSEPVFVAFASQKGGSGKSTLTALMASHLYYLDGIDVLVIDCDERQHTQKDYRDNDAIVLNESPQLKKAFAKFYEKFGKPPYEILYTKPEDAIDVAKEYLEDDPSVKVVFFDITGTINDMRIVNLITSMHYLFVPISPDTGDLKSSLRFANKVKVEMIEAGGTSIRELKLIWNKVQRRQKTKICELIDNYMEELHISSLRTVLSSSTKYFKDGGVIPANGIFRSTMMPPDKQLLKGSNLPELVKEVREIINV